MCIYVCLCACLLVCACASGARAHSTVGQFLDSHHDGAFEDARTELVIDDAKAWLERHDGKFDVMVMDLADPVDDGPVRAAPLSPPPPLARCRSQSAQCFLLYTVKFYQFCREKLADNGILVTQSGPAGLYTADQVFSAIACTLQKAFSSVNMLVSHVPSFGDVYGFGVCAANGELPDLSGKIDALIEERIAEPAKLRYFDEQTYQHMKNLPKYLRSMIANEKRLITEETPLFIH